MTTAKAQAAQVNAAYATNPNVAPTTEWQQIMPNPNGIQNFHSQYVDVRANPLDPSMVQQKGAHVGQDAAPMIVADLSKEILDVFGRGFLRSVPKAPWAQTLLRPTAAVDGGVGVDSFTVAGAAVLPQSTLIRTRGFANAANNGVFPLAAGSTAIALNVVTATTVAEAVAPLGSAQAEICGFQGAAADLSINAAGNIASVAQNLTVFQLQPGHKVYWRASAHGTAFPTGGAFPVAGMYWGTVVSVTNNEIVLKDRGYIPATGGGPLAWAAAIVSGAGKTIRLHFGVLFRNVPDGHGDYLDEAAWWLELRDSGVGAANGAVFSYAESAVLNTISLALGVETKIEATLGFLARRVIGHLEVGARYAGAAGAFRPLSTALFHTAVKSMLVHRVMNTEDQSTLVAEVTSATLSLAHNESAKKMLGGDGSAGGIAGDIVPALTLNTFFERAAVPRAIDNETVCRYEMLVNNTQGAIAIDIPTGLLNNGGKTYAENQPVMMDVAFVPHGDPTNGNLVMCINVLPYLPTVDPVP